MTGSSSKQNEQDSQVEINANTNSITLRNIKLWHIIPTTFFIFFSTEFGLGLTPHGNAPFLQRIYTFLIVSNKEVIARNTELQKLKTQQESVKDLINNWKIISSLEEKSKASDYVQQNIDGIVRLYKQIDATILYDRHSIAYYAALAQLCVILTDKTRNPNDLECATKSIDQLNKVHDNKSTKTIEDVSYITKYNPLNRIKITELNIAAFDNLLNPSPNSRKKAEAMLKDFGGCAKLGEETIRHKNIYEGLNCKYPY